MRAWYGKGRFWFVVAASASTSTAWGWYGYQARWQSLGEEFVDWFDTEFGAAIELSAIPAEMLAMLAETLADMAAGRSADAMDVHSTWSAVTPATASYH